MHVVPNKLETTRTKLEQELESHDTFLILICNLKQKRNQIDIGTKLKTKPEGNQNVARTKSKRNRNEIETASDRNGSEVGTK